MTTIWTVNCTSYEMAKDIKRGDFEDVSPWGVYSDRDAAVASIVKEMNVSRKECREDEELDEARLPGFTDFPDVHADHLRWEDCPTYGGTMRWKMYDEHDESWYIITQLELDKD